MAKDPRSILGWGGVAVINGLGARIGWLPDRGAAIRRVEFASARLGSPREPLLGAWHLNLGICHFMRGEYADATDSARVAVQLSPTLPVPPLILAAALARDGKADEGRAIVATHLQRHPGARAADVPKLLRGDAPPFVAGRTRVMESLRELGMP